MFETIVVLGWYVLGIVYTVLTILLVVRSGFIRALPKRPPSKLLDYMSIGLGVVLAVDSAIYGIVIDPINGLMVLFVVLFLTPAVLRLRFRKPRIIQ